MRHTRGLVDVFGGLLYDAGAHCRRRGDPVRRQLGPGDRDRIELDGWRELFVGVRAPSAKEGLAGLDTGESEPEGAHADEQSQGHAEDDAENDLFNQGTASGWGFGRGSTGTGTPGTLGAANACNANAAERSTFCGKCCPVQTGCCQVSTAVRS